MRIYLGDHRILEREPTDSRVIQGNRLDRSPINFDIGLGIKTTKGIGAEFYTDASHGQLLCEPAYRSAVTRRSGTVSTNASIGTYQFVSLISIQARKLQ